MEERDRASEGDMLGRDLASWETPLHLSPITMSSSLYVFFYHDAIYRIRSDKSKAGCSRTCRSAVPSDRRVQRPCSRWRIDHSGGRIHLRFQPLLRPPLPPPSTPPISTQSIQREFPEELSPSAKGSKFNTRKKTIIEAMARDDGRDGTQGEEGRDRQEDSLPQKVRSSGYLACFLVSLYQ